MAESVATEEQTQDAPNEAAAEVHEVQLPEAEANVVQSAGGQIDILLDATVEVSVQFGHVQMPARELIQLGPGSVLKLDRQIGEPVELLMRGIPFATGRLVVVGDRLGVKVEQILPAAEQDG